MRAGAPPGGAGWGLRCLQRRPLPTRRPLPPHVGSASRPCVPPWHPPACCSLDSKGKVTNPERFTAIYTAAGRFTQPK